MNPITQPQHAYLSPVYRSIAINTAPVVLSSSSSSSAAKHQQPQPAHAVSAALLAKLDKLKVAYTYASSSPATLLCRYEAEDGPERCEFTLSGAVGAERTDGCYCLFRRITAELGSHEQQGRRMFRCLALPQELMAADQESVKQELARMDKASSKAGQEQREQFCRTVSGMLMRGEHAAECRDVLQNKPSSMLNACVVGRIMMPASADNSECC